MTAVANGWNFGDVFDELADVLGPAPALIHGDLVRSWSSFGERSNRLARALLAAGLRTDDTVAFYLRNGPAYLELFAACVKARLVHANVNYRYVESELRYILDNSDARAVVFDAEFAPTVDAIRADLPPGTVLVAVNGSATGVAGAADFETLCTQGDASRLGNERSGDDRYFQYTGGTTGMPKAVMWRQHDRISLFAMAVGANAAEHARAVAERSSRPILVPACPLMHSTGLTTAIATLCAGGTVVTLTAPGFDADECLDAIERHSVTTLSIVGDAFSRPLLDALGRGDRSRSLRSLTSISSAGVMWSAESKQGLLRHFPDATLRDALGSSEGSGLASMETRAGGSPTTARFVLGNGVKVFTDDWREVEPGSGELGRIAKSGYLPIGYYNDDAKTAETFPVIDGVRYSVPGDWCTVEADGTITLIGRGSTCINTGGEKVFPEEVETALTAQPEVADALVTGIPDERWGQAVAALVALVPGHDLDPDELRERLRSTLAGYKLPRVIRFVDEVPRAPSGKADYAEVRRRFDH